MMDMQYLNSRWVLGWALVKHVLLQPFVRRDPQAWVARIRAERLGATPARAWEHLGPASRCIGCGLCDAVVPGELPVSQWLQGAARQPEDAPLALRAAAVLRGAAADIAAICPARLDVRHVAALIEDHAAMLAPPALQAPAAPPALPAPAAPPPDSRHS